MRPAKPLSRMFGTQWCQTGMSQKVDTNMIREGQIMKRKVKVPAEVLEQLEEQHSQMAEEVRRRMDDKGRIEVSDSRV